MMQPSELETKRPSPTKSPRGRTVQRNSTAKATANKHAANNPPSSENSHTQVESSLVGKNSASTASSGGSKSGVPPHQDGKKDAPTPSGGFLPVLKNGNFLALWGGQVFSQLADKVYLVLMIALINSQFHRTEEAISVWVSALMMAFTIPAVLFGSVAGVFVDRWSKKAVLVATNIWRGILVLSIPVLLWLTRHWHSLGTLPAGFLMILAITFAVSTLTQFFAPAEQATIPLIVDEEDLLSANSLYTTTMMASVIIGFAVGEPLLVGVEKIWSGLGGMPGLGKEILVGGSYAIAGLILLILNTNEKQHPHHQEQPHIFADLRDGLRYIKTRPSLGNAIIQLVILFSVFAALTVLAVRLAEIIPGLKTEQFGFLLAAGGVGMALGAMLIGQFGHQFRRRHLSSYGCIGMAVALGGLSVFTSNLWLVLLLVASIGIFGALIGIPMQTTIQTQTPPEMRGKVFGLQNNVINIALSLPLALTGIMETFVGLKPVFLGLAAIVVIVSIFTWYNSPE